MNGLWLKFLALPVKQDDSRPLQYHCLRGDEFERGRTLGICDEYKQIVEVVMPVITDLSSSTKAVLSLYNIHHISAWP